MLLLSGIALLSYLGPAILVFSPYFVGPPKSHQARILQLVLAAVLTVFLTVMNVFNIRRSIARLKILEKYQTFKQG